MSQRRFEGIDLPVFITTNTAGNEKLFLNRSAAANLRACILAAAKLKNWDIASFQIMPDHVHLLVAPHAVGEHPLLAAQNPVPPQSGFSKPRKQFSVSNFVQSFKGSFSRQIHKGRLWQSGFYLKHITDDEQLHSTIAYIIGNPEKDGLPEIFTKVPYAFIDLEVIDTIFGQ